MRAILSLQVPELDGNRGVTIAATGDPEMLLAFRRFVLKKYEDVSQESNDGIVRRLRWLDYERVKQALDAVVPEE